jgi:hypothetical protein
MQVPEWLRQNVHGSMTRTMNAQSEDDVRHMMDAARRGGYARGPATDWMANQSRNRALANTAEGIQGFETSYALAGADRRAGALGQNASLQTQVNVGNADRRTNVSGQNAQLGTQVSMFNAGEQNQASQFGAAARNQAAAFGAAARNAAAGRAAASANQAASERGDAARFLLGYGRQGEAMDLQRYGQLHGMNMDWQRPQYQVNSFQEPNTFSRIMGGVGAGLNMAGQIGGMFGGGGGGGYGGGGGGSQFRAPAPTYADRYGYQGGMNWGTADDWLPR